MPDLKRCINDYFRISLSHLLPIRERMSQIDLGNNFCKLSFKYALSRTYTKDLSIKSLPIVKH